MPTIGYGVSYAIGNILLALSGSRIVILVAGVSRRFRRQKRIQSFTGIVVSRMARQLILSPRGRLRAKEKCRPPEILNSYWSQRDVFPTAPSLASLVSSAH